jgi:hypothetical protein
MHIRVQTLYLHMVGSPCCNAIMWHRHSVYAQFVSMLDGAEPVGPDVLLILRNEIASLNNLLEESAHALQAINDKVVPSRLQNL